MKTIIICKPDHKKIVNYTREASRAIIMRGREVLTAYEALADRWELPGGGREDGETYEDCCVREVLEETGNIAKIREPFIEVIEYYDEAMMTSRFFVCDIIGKGERHLTSYEEAIGSRPEWIDIDKLLGIIGKSRFTDERTDESHRMHLREWTVLSEYKKSLEEKAE